MLPPPDGDTPLDRERLGQAWGVKPGLLSFEPMRMRGIGMSAWSNQFFESLCRPNHIVEQGRALAIRQGKEPVSVSTLRPCSSAGGQAGGCDHGMRLANFGEAQSGLTAHAV
jgi:hypothetical protein